MNVFIEGQHYPITGTSGRGVYTTLLEGAMLQGWNRSPLLPLLGPICRSYTTKIANDWIHCDIEKIANQSI